MVDTAHRFAAVGVGYHDDGYPAPQWASGKIIVETGGAGNEGEIVSIDPATGISHNVTKGRDPRVSPDQQTVAFVRGDTLTDRFWARDQLYTLRLRTPGLVKQITHDRDGIGNARSRFYAWSPDSRRIALRTVPALKTYFQQFLKSPSLPPASSTVSTVAIQGVLGPDTSLNDKTLVRVFDVESGAAQTVYDRDVEELSGLGWIPHKNALLFNPTFATFEHTGEIRAGTSLSELDLSSRHETVVLDRLIGGQGTAAPRASPDGRRILFLSDPWERLLPQRSDLAVLDIGSHSVTFPKVPAPVTDPIWGADGVSIFGVAGTAMARRVFVVRPGATARFLSTDDGTDANPAPSPDGRWVAWLHFDLLGRESVRIVGLRTQHERDLLTLSDPLRNIRVGTIRRVTWRAPDGLSLVGLLVTPPILDPAKQYPMIVFVHGGEDNGLNLSGPALMESIAEFHYWAGLGYAIFAPDYRTSQLYGPAVINKLRATGNRYIEDAKDVLSGTDSICKAEKRIDCSKLALFGQSWGGAYATLIMTLDHRFKAGVIADGLGDSWENAGGNVKQGLDAFYMGRPRSHTTEYNANSSVYNAARIDTPTLWMQAENGANSPSDYYIFRSMQTRNIPTVRLFYHGDFHVLQRPANRLDFLHRIRTWLNKYVPPTTAQPGAEARRR